MKWQLLNAICIAFLSIFIPFTTGAEHATNNWAVLVCTSRFWFNYRHIANTLSLYRTVRRLGIPDEQIILMLADDIPCNPRNPFPGSVFADAHKRSNGEATWNMGDLMGDRVEVDYKGEEVNVEQFLRLLSGRHSPSTPPSKRLLTNSRSNILVYMTGHGGEEFLKFQDSEEISAMDLADAVDGMWQMKRYNEILFMFDTCQANTLYSRFYSPNLIATGSSDKNENSLSHHSDSELGVSVIDRYTHHVLNFLESINQTSKATLDNLFATFSIYPIFQAHPGVRTDLFPRKMNETLLIEFFGGVKEAEIDQEEEDVNDIFLSVEDGPAVESPVTQNEKEVAKYDQKTFMNVGLVLLIPSLVYGIASHL